jgi:DNA polymerase III subunit gamma/tau
MSYQVLARKYRPRNFDTLVGQEHVVRALTHALEHKRLHHAYLFTGTRGVGKTTLSRILAKALNCIGTDGAGDITASPCGVCEACVAIDAGRFVDYIEMDAASNRGVDEMTQLLEQAVYAPSNARFKVYMIDEVHMLTNQAFNSMLKTLEEPPEHVKFILATTDPQKIPVTVLSRCLQFNLKQMPPGHIVSHLENILGQEQITFEVSALRLLAQGAQGSMRDGLSLTDQAIAYAAGKVTLEAVQGMLGTLDQAYLISLLDALAAQDGARLLAVADDMAARSLSYSAALQDLATLFNRIAIAQSVPQAIPEDLPEREEILRLSAQFSPEDVQLFYQIAAHGRHELGLAPDEYAGFTMTLLRMLAFTPLWSDGKSAPQQTSSTGPATSVKKAEAAASVVSASTNKISSTATGASPSAATEKPVSPAMAALAAARSPKANNATASARTAPAASEKPQAAAENTTSPTDTAQKKTENSAPAEILVSAAPAKINTTNLFSNWDGSWPTLVRALSVRGVAQQLASQSELLACEPEGNVVMMRLRVPVDTLLSAGSADKLSAALTEYLGKTIKLVTEIGTVAHTAHAQVVAEQATRQQEAEDAMHNDPFVQTLIKEFGGTIVPGSIKPA